MMMSKKEDFVFRLKLGEVWELLKEHGCPLSVAEISRSVEINRETVSKALQGERHNITIENLARLALFFGVELQSAVELVQSDVKLVQSAELREQIKKVWEKLLEDGDIEDGEIKTIPVAKQKQEQNKLAYGCALIPESETVSWFKESIGEEPSEDMEELLRFDDKGEARLHLVGGTAFLGRSSKTLDKFAEALGTVDSVHLILLKDPENMLGRIHLKLVFLEVEGLLLVQDMNTTNYTYFRAKGSKKSQQIFPRKPRILRDGDLLILTPDAERPRRFRVKIDAKNWG